MFSFLEDNPLRRLQKTKKKPKKPNPTIGVSWLITTKKNTYIKNKADVISILNLKDVIGY